MNLKLMKKDDNVALKRGCHCQSEQHTENKLIISFVHRTQKERKFNKSKWISRHHLSVTEKKYEITMEKLYYRKLFTLKIVVVLLVPLPASFTHSRTENQLHAAEAVAVPSWGVSKLNQCHMNLRKKIYNKTEWNFLGEISADDFMTFTLSSFDEFSRTTKSR